MKIKQIKTFFFAVSLILSTLVGAILIGNDTAMAYTCPPTADGKTTEFHATDNSCWIYALPSGCVRENGRNCVKEYTRTNLQPAYEDGSAATFSCPAGQEYHSSDNKCWAFELPANCARDNGRNCTKEYVEKGSPSISKDYKAEYCGTNFPQETDACKAGQKDADCSKYADKTQKEACAEGAATKLCGVNDGKGTERSAEARRQCYSEVKACLTSDKPVSEQQQCASKVSGVDQKEIDKLTFKNPIQTDKKCGEAETVLISCQGEDGATVIGNVLRIFISVLTVLIGIAAVGGIAWASVVYAKAEDNASEVSSARTLIRNIVIGILLYGFMIGIINWLVPGGVIG